MYCFFIIEFYFTYNLTLTLNKFINKYYLNYALIELQIVPYFLNKLCLILKYNQLYLLNLCIDVLALDIPGKYFRFSLIYNFLSILYNFRLRIILQTNEIFPVESLTNLFPNATWIEREIWDLLGIFFIYNKDLRRILTDYGFLGAPLRRDFPLSGFTEIAFDDVSKHVYYSRVELTQAYRTFKYNNPWKIPQ